MKVLLILMCISPFIVFCQQIDSSNFNPNITDRSFMYILRNDNENGTENANKQLGKREIIVVSTGKEDIFQGGVEDETLTYVSYITKKLKSVQDMRQRWLCEHLIETSIHKAFLGELTDKSDILERGVSVYKDTKGWTSSSQQIPHVSQEKKNTLDESEGETTNQPPKEHLPFFSDVNPNMGGLPQEQRRRVREIHTYCQDNPNTFVNEDLLRRLRNNKDNKQVQIHMFCMAEQIGLVKNNGEFNPSIIRTTTSFLFKEDAALNEMYKKCAVTKRTKEETITYFWLCLIAHSTQYYNKA